MRAVKLVGPGDLRMVELAELPPPGRGEVLIQVTAVGICGSDLHTYRGGGDLFAGPVILGHEFAGRVLALGPEAQDGNGEALKVGTRVAVDPAQPCGKCPMCRQGNENLCPEIRFCGLYPHDGGLRERICVPARTVFPLPDDLDDDSAAMLEPLGVALHAVRLAAIEPRESALCIGAGPIGLCVIQVARLAGVGRIFVAENLSWRSDAAEAIGGEPLRGSPVERTSSILRHTGSLGVDVVFEAAWAGDALEEGLEGVRPGGRMLLIGIPEEDLFRGRHSIARRKGIRLTFVRRMLRTYPRAIELVASGRIDVKGIVTHRVGLAQTAEAFRLNSTYAPGLLKVIVHPGE